MADYNTLLIDEAKKNQTRSWGLQLCTYIAADALGAYDLGSVGFKLGGFLGPNGALAGATVGGIIGGVGASYLVYDQFNGYTQDTNTLSSEMLIQEVEQAYVFFMQSGGLDNIINSNDLGISVKYDKSQLIGLIHNEVLDILITKKYLITSIDTDAYFSPEEKYVLDSQQYIADFSKFMKYETSEIIASYGDGINDQISKLYFDILSTYPTNSSEVKEISNVYAKATADCGELSEDEKVILISGYSTATKSGEYWTEKLNIENDDYK